jgi:urease accessory protein UreF
MFNVDSIGSWDDTVSFLEYLLSGKMYDVLDRYGRLGVDRLASATPMETGLTAHSWGYQVESKGDHHSISWFNTHTHNGVNIAVILQYGHGTGTGGWVEGRDYINPAIQPVFDKMVEDIWSEVRNA